MTIYQLSVFVFFLCADTLSVPIETVQAVDSKKLISLGEKAFLLEDPEGKLSISVIQEKRWQDKFQPSGMRVLDFPVNDSYYWVKLKITFPSNDDYVLFIDEAKIRYADLYYSDDGRSWKVIYNGNSVPAKQKQVVHNFQVYSLDRTGGKTLTFYFKLKPNGSSIPLYAVSKSYFFQQYDSMFKIIFGLVIGIILFISINNLTYSILHKAPLRFWYFLMSISFVVFLITYNGYTVFISDLIYEHNSQLAVQTTFVSQLFVLLYGYNFLKVGAKKMLKAWWVGTITITSILLCWSIFNSREYLGVALVGINGLLSILTCFITGLITYTHADNLHRPIYYIYAGSYFLFLFFLVLELGHVNLEWPYIFFFKYIDISFLAEAFGLATAQNTQSVIERKAMETQSIETQREINKLVNERNQVLEQQVYARTHELAGKTKIAEELSSSLLTQSNELRKLNELKDRLMSILAHDLKSPLIQLQGLLSLADKSLTEQELKFFLQKVGKQMGLAIDLSNNLLLWAKSQMEGFQLKIKQLHLRPLIDSKFSFFESIASEKGIQLSNNVPTELVINSDQDVVSLLAHNLLHNAIKFTNVGGTISVSATQSINETIFFVKDNGIGMTIEKVRAILGSVTYSTVGTKNEKGSGLGLKICKDLVQQIGGQIRIDSVLGQGTRFSIAIPIRQKQLNEEVGTFFGNN